MYRKSIATFLTLTMLVTVALAQTDTLFTYQGELKENGVLADGSFDMDFSLWDAASAGNQFGSTIVINDVPVVDGKFTVELDFGAVALDNSDRWLEIEIDAALLSPRNPLTRSPYSIQTRGIFVDDNYEVGIGTVFPLEAVHVWGNASALRLEDDDLAGSHTVLRDSAQTQAQLQKVNLSGNVILDIDPIAADGTSDASLRLFRSTNTAGLKRVLFYRGNNTTATSAAIGLDGADSYFQIQGGNVGIGTANPLAPLHVASNRSPAAIFEGRVEIGTEIQNANLDVIGNVLTYTPTGTAIYCQTDSGNALRGFSASLTGDYIGVLGESSSTTGKGVAGEIVRTSGVNYAVYALNRSAQGFDFFAAGAGADYGSSSSRRWKSNIVEIDQPLRRISQLRGVYFDWDQDHGGHHDVGMIAEEVGKVLPEIVQYEENGVDALGMDYSKLTPLLVEAVKELQDENDSLRARIDTLEKLVKQLASNNQEPSL